MSETNEYVCNLPHVPMADADGYIVPAWRAWCQAVMKRTGDTIGVPPAPDLTDELQAETDARAAADTALSGQLANETAARASGDAALNAAIANEAAARVAADQVLAAGAGMNLQAKIDAEQAARIAADNAEASARAAGDTAAHWALLDLSGLPTSDPGGGRPWLSSGNIRVGP